METEDEIKRLLKRNRLLMMKIAGVTEMAYQARNMEELSAEQSANVLSAICYTLDLGDDWWLAHEFKSIDTMTYDAIQSYIAANLKRFGAKQ